VTGRQRSNQMAVLRASRVELRRKTVHQGITPKQCRFL
jgi:hypothetical protein